MDQIQLDKIKLKLETELAQIKSDLSQIAEPDKGDHAPGEYVTKFPDYGEDEDSELTDYSPSEVEDYTRDLSVTGTLEKRLHEIEAALKRLNAGTYGICNKCGKQIPTDRLKINPEADTCVQCV